MDKVFTSQKVGVNMFKNRWLVAIILLIGVVLIVTGCGTSNDDNGQQDQSEPVIPSHIDYDGDDSKQIIDPQNELGFKLLSKVEADEDDNIFISPTSLFMALSMVLNGADGMTKDEMTKTLQSKGIEVDELNKANAALLAKLHETSSSELNIANSFWLNDMYSLEDDFQKNTTDHFNAKVEEIDIDDSTSADVINDWVEQATNEKITDMVDYPFNQDLIAFIINAIYFKGDWQYEFDSNLTKKHDFKTGDDGSVQVPLMTLDETLNYLETDKFQAVELPYTDQEMSMHVFLPKEDFSLDELTQSLTLDQWNQWQDEFSETEGTLLLPKFELEYEVILNDPLRKLGMKTAFDLGKAEFPNMTQGNDEIAISEVKQKSYVMVNEEGTEAAAATSSEMETTSFNPDSFEMSVNRPFFFTITDNKTGAILFMGSISEPPRIEE